jgi:hypothetical protein
MAGDGRQRGRGAPESGAAVSDDTIRVVYGLAVRLGRRADTALAAARCPGATSRDLWDGLVALSPLALVNLWGALQREERWQGEEATR